MFLRPAGFVLTTDRPGLYSFGLYSRRQGSSYTAYTRDKGLLQPIELTLLPQKKDRNERKKDEVRSKSKSAFQLRGLSFNWKDHILPTFAQGIV